VTQLPKQVDVAIVGGGPVGLTAACVLQAASAEILCWIPPKRERTPHVQR